MFIRELTINNFRGIKDFKFHPNAGLTCFIGRGDTGKSTILEAINILFSSSWSTNLCDSDFHKLETDAPILIEAVISNVPEVFMTDTKYGLYLHSWNKETKSLLDELSDEHEPVLLMRFTLNKDLEPKWVFISISGEERTISPNDRGNLGVNLLNDYTDSHFSFAKGSPLSTLMRNLGLDLEDNPLVEIFRTAKKAIDEHEFDGLEKLQETVKTRAQNLGLNIDTIKPSVEIKDLNKGGRLVIHSNDLVPAKMSGRGSKRLLSIAIQTALITKTSGMPLIDEIEYSLEPDRVKSLVSQLKTDIGDKGQIFITSHSDNVLEELDFSNIFVMKNNKGIVTGQYVPEDFQNLVKGCPSAFFGKKIICCEGATELGICNALNKFRVLNNKSPFSFLGISRVDAVGADNLERMAKKFKDFGYKTLIFCDSDKATLNTKKEEIRTAGITIIDAEEGNSLETQVFSDMPWETINKFISLAILLEKNEPGILNAIKEKLPEAKKHLTNTPFMEWADDADLRVALGLAAHSGKWFKKEGKGTHFGQIIFDNWAVIHATKRIKENLSAIDAWVEQ